MFDTVDLDEGLARHIVRVQPRRAKRQHRREAAVASFQTLAPVV